MLRNDRSDRARAHAAFRGRGRRVRRRLGSFGAATGLGGVEDAEASPAPSFRRGFRQGREGDEGWR